MPARQWRRLKLTPEQSAARFQNTKVRFRIYICMLALLAIFFLLSGVNALYNEHLRRSPATQTVTATVTNYKYVCDRAGCGYDSFGNYTIDGKNERGKKLISMAKVPIRGQLAVLVNPTKPGMAMNAYHDPFRMQAAWFGGYAAFVIMLGLTVTLLRRRWGKKVEQSIPTS